MRECITHYHACDCREDRLEKLEKAYELMFKALETYEELEFNVAIKYGFSRTSGDLESDKWCIDIDSEDIQSIFKSFRNASSSIATLAEVEKIMGEK